MGREKKMASHAREKENQNIGKRETERVGGGDWVGRVVWEFRGPMRFVLYCCSCAQCVFKT